jgi:hypothetical protein
MARGWPPCPPQARACMHACMQAGMAPPVAHLLPDQRLWHLAQVDEARQALSHGRLAHACARMGGMRGHRGHLPDQEGRFNIGLI